MLSGCNIVDSTCRCERSKSCAESSPFNFKTRQECQMNLNVMLARKSAEDEDDGSDEGGGSIDDEGEFP